MKKAEILGANRFETFSRTREGSRAVIVRDGMILLSHETKSGWWLVPGGGMEEGETPEECCVRETEEETGLIVRPVQQFLTLYEYYEEYRYISYYFVCEAVGTGKMHLTDAEVLRGLEPEWLPLQEAVELFSGHESWASVSEEKRGSYLREYTALQEYLKFRTGADGRPDEAGKTGMRDAFLSVAAVLNRHLQAIPLLFGSMGLEQRLGTPLNPDDIDILLPERCLTDDWQKLTDLMQDAGYVLRDKEEHEFAKDDIRVAFACIENLKPFAGVDIRNIPLVRESGASYLLLELPDYLKVYEASSRDGYRKNVKNKQDQQKIDLIRKALQEKKSPLSDQSAVKTQYASPAHLGTRISIHTKYSKNRQGFGNWIAEHYPAGAGLRVLELGCGTGEFWVNRKEIIERCSKIILTDISEGMLSEAKDRLKQYANMEYAAADIQDIPFADGSFDLVIANMMLYHVPDIPRGLSEVRRVLRDGGTFCCATFGEHGIMEYLAGLFRGYGVKEEANHTFTLQNGKAQLQEYFDTVERYDYEDSLEVTGDMSDLADYICSLTGMSQLSTLPGEVIVKVLSGAADKGVLRIPKEYGLFLSR